MDYLDDLNVAISLAGTVLSHPADAMGALVNHNESILDNIFISDAIAHLCVRAMDDRFAVACSVDVKLNEIYLFVAGRNGVNPSTVLHLHRLWGLMKTISFYSTESLKMSARSQDTKALDNLTAETYAILSREVYEFMFAVFKRRFCFWIEQLHSPILNQSISKLPHIPFFNAFFKLIMSVKACHISLLNCSEQEGGLNEKRLTDLVYSIDSLTRFACDVFATSGLYEAWSAACKWTDKLVLKKALQEMTYTHRAVYRLLFYAHKPDLPIYHMSLIVIPIASYTPRIPTWPSSTMEWRMIRETIYSQFNYASASTPRNSFHHQRNPLPPQCLTVHPECALIEFLHWASIVLGSAFIPPFSYIGMSGPPCVPCNMWIRAYVAWTRYAGEYTNRSDSRRWERDCALPRLAKTVEQRLAHDVLSQFCIREERLGKIQASRFYI